MRDLFNWKKRPASVWFIAGPLALLGLSLHVAVGVLRLVHSGDPWFLVIAVGFPLLVFVPMVMIRKRLLKPKAEA